MSFRSAAIGRPRYVWIAIVLEVFTAVLAIPVGLMFITDPSGAAMGIEGWLDGTVFGDFLVPGLYLFAVNGIGMLALALLTLRRHRVAPWLTGALGIGLMIWIAVQVLLISETMILQPLFFAVGLILGFIALFWLLELRRRAAFQGA